MYVPSKKRTRNLTQYRNMTEEEFEDFWDEKYGENTQDDQEILE